MQPQLNGHVKKLTRLVIMRSEDNEVWEPVDPKDVPKWLKEDDVMADLDSGLAVYLQDTNIYYCGLRPEELLRKVYEEH